MPEPQPLLMFVPPELSAADQNEWVEAMIAELGSAEVVASADAEPWRVMLSETAKVGLHRIAVGQVLMILPGAQPLYVWVTVGERPAGRAASLVDAIGAEFAAGFAPQRFQREIRDGVVELGFFLGRESLEDSVDVVYGVAAAAATLELPEVGQLDTCVWCTSTEIDQLEEALPALAGLVRDPDLVTYLST